MEPRINLIANELGAKIGKRFYHVSLAIEQSALPKAAQDLVMLRASQINGCGFCVDMHTKEAAAAGETALRLNLVAVINAANRLNVIVRNQGGAYEPGMLTSMAS